MLPPPTEQMIAAAIFAIRIFFMHFFIKIFSFQEEKTTHKLMIAENAFMMHFNSISGFNITPC